MEDIVRELHSIRILLMIGVVLYFMKIAYDILYQWRMVKQTISLRDRYERARQPKNEFEKKAKELVAELKYEELIELAKSRKSEKPGDPYGSYYLALAYYHQNRHEEAIKEFRETVRLAPSWEDSVSAYLKQMEVL